MQIQDAIIPIAAILGSGITAAVVSHILSARKEERLLVLQKLEDLHNAVHNYCSSVAFYGETYTRAMEGHITYNQVLDIFLESDLDTVSPPIVQRLIGLYFPDLEQLLTDLITSYNKLHFIQEDFKEDYLAGITSHGPWLKPFCDEIMRFVKTAEKLKKRVVTHPIKITKR